MGRSSNGTVKGVKEDLSLDVIERAFARNNNLRIVVGAHPVTGKPSSSVPYLDLANALTCPSKTIFSIISRSERVKRYCSIFMMKTEAGLRPTLCLFEEGVLHAVMKLEPSRCKDPAIGDRLDEIQDELIQILRDALHGFTGRTNSTSLATAKTLAMLINAAGRARNPEHLAILNDQIERLSGRKVLNKQPDLPY